MTLKELLNLVQTDPIEALKEAFEMGSKWAEGRGSSQECDYTEEQFMAFMDGAKSGMGLKVASIDTSKLTEIDVEKYLKLIEKWKLKPELDPETQSEPESEEETEDVRVTDKSEGESET